ncbi:aldehyde dehydrogenase [Trichoderma citrinoviride]|uniref:Aldehyde dehydrogenase n=1 Tax=Trichoderma citrinoviride TaxID=58853 RepID=A0A2T4BFY0_9HYPO|nr:aldehyde dehydrogenase [Trichoderma citrinoviride]PTB68227.1 aldehyde dehydrogenase [Trichoderma citrinoviride]
MFLGDTKDAHVVPFFINGKDYHPERSFDVVSPVTGKVSHRCGAATVSDAAAAVDAAAAAFKTWRRTSPAYRRDIFLKAADLIQQKGGELADVMANETGASLPWALFNIKTAAELIRDAASRISAIEGSFPSLADPNSSGIVLREPYGVVLSVAPWNAPYILPTRSIVGPAAAGNTVVLKASEHAPACMRALIYVFHEAGVPSGVINMIAHDRDTAAEITTALIANPHVRKINFTGSTGVGRVIGRLAGEHLKPVILELGGKAPAIVWEDADLDLAAQQCAIGAFLHGGQICMSTEKIIVHSKVRPQFQEKLVAAVNEIFPPDSPAPLLINEAAVKRNKALVQDAAAKGATVILGNVHNDDDDANESSRGGSTELRPVIVGDVTPEMDLYATESFGPTVSLHEVETEAQALALANDSEYGLTAAVFTDDLRRGLRFAREIDSGAVHINDMTVHDEPALPHGGTKSSGFGRFNSAIGLDEWVRTKTVTFKH